MSLRYTSVLPWVQGCASYLTLLKGSSIDRFLDAALAAVARPATRLEQRLLESDMVAS